MSRDACAEAEAEPLLDALAAVLDRLVRRGRYGLAAGLFRVVDELLGVAGW